MIFLRVLNPYAYSLCNVIRIKLHQPQQGRTFSSLLKETGWLLLSVFISSVLARTLFSCSPAELCRKMSTDLKALPPNLSPCILASSCCVILDLFSNSSQRLQSNRCIWAQAATQTFASLLRVGYGASVACHTHCFLNSSAVHHVLTGISCVIKELVYLVFLTPLTDSGET